MNVSILSRSGKEHVMSVETYTRWLCLIEGLDVITQAAEKHSINLDKNDSWIKPLALQDYVKERFPAMLHDICIEESIDMTPDPTITPTVMLSIPVS